MSILVMSRVWENRRIATSAELVLLLSIADHANDDGTGAWPSMTRLAHLTRMSERSVSRTCNELAARGLLTVKLHGGPGGRVNLYSIPMTDTSQIGISANDDGCLTPISAGGTTNEPPEDLNPSPTERTQSVVAAIHNDSLASHLVNEGMRGLEGRRSWDLLSEVFLPAYDEVLAHGTIGDAIALVALYLEAVTGEAVDAPTRALIAMTVRKSGKVALVGWDTALGTTEKDDSRSRLAYARAVIKRTMAEMQSA